MPNPIESTPTLTPVPPEPTLTHVPPPISLAPTAGLNQVIIRDLPDGGLEVIRRDDLLVLRFEFIGITVVRNGPKAFLFAVDNGPNVPEVTPRRRMVIHFQQQAIAEFATSAAGLVLTFPSSTIAAGDSQLVFEVPFHRLPMEVTVENLLDWSGFVPMLAPVALTEAQATSITNPPPEILDPSAEGLTFIEAPYRLLLSPSSDANWQHQQGLQTTGTANETELWHTALTSLPRTGDLRVRAIWSPDVADIPLPPVTINQVPTMTLTGQQRKEIVNLSSSYTSAVVNSIPADQFMLTALGGWMQLRGDWGPSSPNISAWHSRSTMAREHHAVVITEGYLFPFGHRAATVTITDRAEGRTMFLFSKTHIVVRDRVLDLSAAGAARASMRQMPFQQVALLTKRTPDLDQSGHETAFWPTVGGGQPFLFDLVGTDIAGQTCSFQSALYFIDKEALPVANLSAVNLQMAKWSSDLRGQSLALVMPSSTENEIDTAYPAQRLTFQGVLSGSNLPGFFPVMDSAIISIPAIQHLTNVETSVKITYTSQYLSSGLDPLVGYADIGSTFVPSPVLSFASADQSGGFIQPTLTITQLVQKTGLSPGPFTALATPQAAFAHITLLGGISLGDLLPTTIPKGTTPTIKTTRSSDQSVTTQMTWTLDSPAQLRSAGPFEVPKTGPSTSVVLNLLRVQSSQGQVSSLVSSKLSNFTLSLLGIIDVSFNYFFFTHVSGKKPDITVDVKQTVLHAPLDFVQALTSIIPGNGFSNPPSLDITTSGATLGYSLTLPDIAMGNFSLQNINLGSALSIPFTGSPLAFSFHFAEADHPFLLTADFVTGGGYCALELIPTGLQRLDAALEFGGSVQLNLGVASGGVTATSGFHFGLDQTQGKTDYTVFVQASGALEVLDLIAINTEFYVGLDYQPSRTFTGTASLSVEVSVLFFHKSVSLTMHKSYAA